MAKAKDITGQKFGRLTAIRPTEKRSGSSVVWECRCDCGNTAFINSANLQRNNTMSCGCLQRERTSEASRVDIAGKRFGKLTAIRPTEKRSGSSVVWECRCDCGETTFVSGSSLRSGTTKSCGCSNKEFLKMHRADLCGLVDGTSVSMIKSKKVRSNNKTGCTGVYFCRSRGCYRAVIGFRSKLYYIGGYTKFEDAVKVRQKAEVLLHDETVDYYAMWKAKADADHEWAEENPISIRVVEDGDGDFKVYFEPVL